MATTMATTARARAGDADVGGEMFDDGDAREDETYAAGRLAAMVNAYGDAALTSASGTSMATYVRDGVAELSWRGRMMFMDRLSSQGIENAWTIAGEGYELTRRERAAFAGSTSEEDFHVVNEIIGDGIEDGEAVVFEGKVGRLPGSFLNRFSKAFYVEEDDDPLRSEPAVKLFGRASIKKGPLDALLPLYFASNDIGDDAVFIPGTDERADVSLDYRNVPVLPSKRPFAARAGGVSWPAPRLALFPFDSLVDYLRPLAPGVLVGRGYRFTTGSSKRFLDFILVRRDRE